MFYGLVELAVVPPVDPLKSGDLYLIRGALCVGERAAVSPLTGVMRIVGRGPSDLRRVEFLPQGNCQWPFLAVGCYYIV